MARLHPKQVAVVAVAAASKSTTVGDKIVVFVFFEHLPSGELKLQCYMITNRDRPELFAAALATATSRPHSSSFLSIGFEF